MTTSALAGTGSVWQLKVATTGLNISYNTAIHTFYNLSEVYLNCCACRRERKKGTKVRNEGRKE